MELYGLFLVHIFIYGGIVSTCFIQFFLDLWTMMRLDFSSEDTTRSGLFPASLPVANVILWYHSPHYLTHNTHRSYYIKKWNKISARIFQAISVKKSLLYQTFFRGSMYIPSVTMKFSPKTSIRYGEK